MTREDVEKVRKQYPKGTEIELVSMEDPCAIPKGTKGIVKLVDDAGQIHTAWENGQGLAVIPSVDRVRILKRPIDVLVVEPNKEPYQKSMLEKMEVIWELVDGDFEYINIDSNTVLICNENGLGLGLEPNARVNNDVILGTFILAGEDGEENAVSLTDEQIEEYTKQFSQREELTQEDVIQSKGITLYGLK